MAVQLTAKQAPSRWVKAVQRAASSRSTTSNLLKAILTSSSSLTSSRDPCPVSLDSTLQLVLDISQGLRNTQGKERSLQHVAAVQGAAASLVADAAGAVPEAFLRSLLTRLEQSPVEDMAGEPAGMLGQLLRGMQGTEAGRSLAQAVLGV